MTTFVGRERQLGRLQAFLDVALSTQAQVCFVTGEAGAGKTALVNAFVRGVQARDEQIVAALGQCNAQTGAGDAYLPFREALATLTGVADERERLPASPQNGGRLKDLLVRSAHVLVEFGPDLVGTLVPGTLLVAKFGRAVAQKAGLLDELERLVKRHGATGDTAALEQSRIFEQYANVLDALAKEQPLILILDDLHWADGASLNLLFHLSRGLRGSRVLIVGTYRPDDVALGRDGQRHPLETVLNEVQRYRGDVVIDLGKALAGEGRTFVDALVDAEPNRLDEAFRGALYAHTDGQALFTTEVLRNLRERGDLVRDAAGYWVQGTSLDWEALPARVEGVIAERIGRLEQDQRETLTIGSVMGYDFIAQVVARVQKTQERDLIKSLSRELDKRYRLVSERGEVKVGQTFLSLYQFAHIVFQQFLYHALSPAERRLLHADVAEALEALYAGRTDDIALQLAHHYLAAGDDERASGYLIHAGDAAAQAYAPVEARLHYAQALDALARLPDSADNGRQRVDTLIKQAHVSIRAAGPQQTLAAMRQAEALLEHLHAGGPTGSPEGAADRLRRARVDYWIGMAYGIGNQIREALPYMQRVLPVAQELNDADLLAIPATTIGRALVIQGRYDQAEPLLAQALPLLAQVQNWHEWALATTMYAMALVERGKVAEGIGAAQAGLVRVTAVNTATGIALSHNGLGLSYLLAGDWTHALAHAQLALDVATKAGDRLLMYLALGTSALARVQLGDLQAADRDVAQWQAIVKQLGGHAGLEEWFAVGPAEAALRQNHIEEALILAEQVAQDAQTVGDIFAEGWARRVQAEAQARLQPPSWEAVGARFTQSMQLFEAGGARLEAAHTHVAWGKVLARRGDAQAAREHFELAAAQYEASGLDSALMETRQLIPEATSTSAEAGPAGNA